MKFISNISDNTPDDLSLVEEYQTSRDLKVLGTLYSRYMDLIYGVTLKYLDDPAVAQDAVMNIFEELVHKLHKHQIVNFKSWLYTLAKNHCLMHLRSIKNRAVVELNPALMQNPEELHLNGMLENENSLKALHNCLEDLSAEQRSSVRMFYLEEKSYKEISSITGLEAGKVRSHIQNGRRNLKICMDKHAANES